MQIMKLSTRVCLLGLFAPVLMFGCVERREGIGGGARSPVKVKMLMEQGFGGAATSEVQAATGEKITEFGTFRGKISIKGTAPVLSPLVAQGAQMKDAICSQMAVPDESAVVGPQGGLANVFVFLRKVPNVDIPEPPTDPVVVDQKGCKFVPHALIVRTGQPLKLINSDPVAHNVGITGTAMSFNQTIPASDLEGLTLSYERPERVPVPTRCDFHGWMRGWQLAVDHPWFALTGDDGSFEIADVPAGEMEFVIWHEKLGYIEKQLKVAISPDAPFEKTIEIDASRLAAQ